MKQTEFTRRWGRWAACCSIVAAFAWTLPATAEVVVGTAEVVVKQVTGRLGVESRKIVVEDSVHQNETLETALESATEVEFMDRSRLSIGPGSILTIDSFVFDAGTESGRMGLNAVLGVFRFASSKTKKIAYDIRTPLATVGVRGSRFTVVVDGRGQTSVTTEDDGVVFVADCRGQSREIRQCGRTLAVVQREDGGCKFEQPETARSESTAARIASMDMALGAPVAPACPQQ